MNYAADMQFNLFSLNSMMMNGWTLGRDKMCLSLSKNKIELKFDIKIPTQNRCLFVMRIKRNEDTEASMMKVDKSKSNDNDKKKNNKNIHKEKET